MNELQKWCSDFCDDHDLTERGREALLEKLEELTKPIAMHLFCPLCNEQHIDYGEFATKPHHTHACQHCGLVWRPAKVYTVGVQFLPGYRSE